jgi:hypothetical protein
VDSPETESGTAWRRRFLQPWLVSILFIAWYLLRLPTRWEFDSYQLSLGCRQILDWLQGRSASLDDPRAFPLFQYLSCAAALWAGEHGIPINIFWVWSACNTIGFGGILIIFYCAALRAKQPAVGWAMIVAILGGPLLVYVPSTYNELAAAAVILCFTAAVLGTASPAMCAILFWLSGITKETAAPLLLAIWLGALWMRGQRLSLRMRIKHGVALVVSLALTLATNAGFNLLRFGTTWNREYLLPNFLNHSWSKRLQNCVALWISPNGGIIEFWPALAIFAFGVIAIARHKSESSRAAIVVGILLGGLTIGLSGWYQPFGWWAWGPRLLFPWLPAATFILLREYPQASADLAGRLVRRPRAFWITAICICLFALPHVLAVTKPDVVRHFFEGDSRFPNGAAPTDATAHYARNVYLAWEKMPPTLLRPIIESVSVFEFLQTACFLAALVTLLGKCRQSLPDPSPEVQQLSQIDANHHLPVCSTSRRPVSGWIISP